MDNLSDLIPLIIILGTFVMSIAQASRKKKQQDAEKTMLPKGVYTEKKEVKYKTILKKAHSFTKDNKTPKEKIETSTTNDNPEVIRTIPASRPKARVTELDKEEEPRPLFDTKDINELRRAIIYSEIFSRKEY